MAVCDLYPQLACSIDVLDVIDDCCQFNLELESCGRVSIQLILQSCEHAIFRRAQLVQGTGRWSDITFVLDASFLHYIPESRLSHWFGVKVCFGARAGSGASRASSKWMYSTRMIQEDDFFSKQNDTVG